MKVFYRTTLFLLFSAWTNLAFTWPLAAASFEVKTISTLESAVPFVGTWQQHCFVTDDSDWLQASLEVSTENESLPLQIIWTRHAYEEDNCKVNYLDYAISYSVLNFAGVEFDLVVEKVFYVVKSLEVERALNSIAYCGIKTWRLGIEQDVSGRDCDGFQQPKRMSKIFSRIEIDLKTPTHLRWGQPSKAFDGSSESLRFRDFEDLVYQKN